MNDIKNLLKSLCDSYCIGSVNEAAKIAETQLSKYCTVKRDNNTVIGEIKGGSDYKIMLDAHIDEVGFVVTNIDDNGFLTVAKCGGIDLRTLPARPVIIHGKDRVKGVFCSTPPHLSSSELSFENIGDFKIDSLLGEKAKEVISLGDYVTFSSNLQTLLGDRVCAKSLDDRAGVVCLIELARRLSGKKLPVGVIFCISDMEELGTRGAKTATFSVDPHEAVAVDVSFATAPDVSSDEAGELSRGAMIGVSPVLCKDISAKFIEIAEENSIPYQQEIMSGRTGTNADVISVNKSGVKTGLLSIPLRNMHTDSEIIDIKDVMSVCDILEKYILSKGVL